MSVIRSSRSGCGSCLSSTSTHLLSPLCVSVRHRFYKPLTNQGINLWRSRMGRIHKGNDTWYYRRTPMDPKPYPEKAENNYWGRTRLWNPIPSKVGIVNRKSEDFDWPRRRPPPTGLRMSQEFFPHFFGRYFPDVECRLVVDTVLNNETMQPVFLFPHDMSKEEIVNYLKNVYGMDNIVQVLTKNLPPRKFKNEVGTIKTLPSYKQATVLLDAPVKIDFKSIKGTEDTPDNKPQVAS